MMPLPKAWSSPPKPSPMSAIRRKQLIWSYAPDWIITILLAALFFSLDKVHGFRRDFSLEDTSISHPFAVHERIPNLALYMICFVAPLLIMPVVNFFTVRSWWDLHNSTLGLILGLALTGAMTQVVKITVGRPRPDLISRCQPPAGSVDPPFGLTTAAICTNTDFAIMNDGFRSFFSGHSSLSFAGMGFLAFYLAGKTHLFDSRGHAAKAWLALVPFMAASLVAISRTMDYRHHWHDVLIGTLVGILFSFFAYHQYYPSLASPLSHRPYSPRIKREDLETLPTHTASNSINVDYPFGGGQTKPTNSVGHTGAPVHHRHTSSFDDFELEGTVMRPSPGPLEEVWKEGEEGNPIENAAANRELAPDGGNPMYSPLPRPSGGPTGGQHGV